jgi:hypothetical protein
MATPRMRTLARAVKTLGGEKALADALGVNVALLVRWLDGSAGTPDAAYFAALEIVARGPYAA